MFLFNFQPLQFLNFIGYLNTSYVSIQYYSKWVYVTCHRFKYILCFYSIEQTYFFDELRDNLNTSYVSIQLHIKRIHEMEEKYLNTSYVSIQYCPKEISLCEPYHLNTSYVSIQCLWGAETGAGEDNLNTSYVSIQYALMIFSPATILI